MNAPSYGALVTMKRSPVFHVAVHTGTAVCGRPIDWGPRARWSDYWEREQLQAAGLRCCAGCEPFLEPLAA